MGTATVAPPLTGADIGSKIGEFGSKVGSQLGKAGMVALRIGGVAVTAISTSQKLGGGTDMVKIFPEATGQPQEGGLNNPGIMMGGRTQTQSQSKADEKDATCTADNQKCKQEEHRGNIQAQQEKKMLVATPANSRWNVPKPHGYTFAMAAAKSVRLALLAQRKEGVDPDPKLDLMQGDRGDKFQEGADKAYQVLLKVLNENKSNGIFAIPKKYELSCYFDGKKFFGANLKYKKEKSRRIDLTVHKGQLMGPGAV